MFGFPNDLNLDDIVGSEIQQICIGRSDVQFRFGSKRHMCSQGLVEVFHDHLLVASWNVEAGWSSIEFQRLLHCAIENYNLLDERRLEIVFDGGLALHLHDNSDEFETIQIYPEFIVI
jgi:hypothetical protein